MHGESVLELVNRQELTALVLASLDPSNWTDLKLTSFQPKTFKEEDVEIAITHCGVCGSDVHTLTQGIKVGGAIAYI